MPRRTDYRLTAADWARRRRWEGGRNLCHLAADTAARAKFLRAAADLMPGPLGE
jgi:hypothetical protein